MEAAALATRRRRIDRALLSATVVVAAAAAIPLAVARLHTPRAAAHVPTVSPTALVQRSGVRIVRVAVSGDGGLLDLRYQVVDSDKAEAVHDPATPPLLIDERSGALVAELLMGHIHNQRPKVGLTYYLLFDNPGDIVRAGHRVTVQLGNARVAHIPVQ